MSGEAASRALANLPGRQADLAQALLDLGKLVVVSLSSGRPLLAPCFRARRRGARHMVARQRGGTRRPGGGTS